MLSKGARSPPKTNYLTKHKCIKYKCIFHFIGMIKSILSQMQKIPASKVECQKNSNLKDSLWLEKKFSATSQVKNNWINNAEALYDKSVLPEWTSFST